jgi:hypothetical protein
MKGGADSARAPVGGGGAERGRIRELARDVRDAGPAILAQHDKTEEEGRPGASCSTAGPRQHLAPLSRGGSAEIKLRKDLMDIGGVQVDGL